jgi:site-specific recombinase XerD
MIPIGPKAQQILLKYFEACNEEEQFIFPRPKSKHCDQWYRKAITRACKKAGVEKWTPNQLRHAGATEIRSKFGLEYAQASLGHSNINTTEIYAKVSYEKAEQVAREIG